MVYIYTIILETNKSEMIDFRNRYFDSLDRSDRVEFAKPARIAFHACAHSANIDIALKQPTSCTLHSRDLFFTQLQLNREDGRVRG